MNTLSYTEVRAGFKGVMDTVVDDHEPVIITRQKGSSAVLLSLEDYQSMEETLYLLSTPANAAHLMESIAQIESGATVTRGLIKNEQESETEKAE